MQSAQVVCRVNRCCKDEASKAALAAQEAAIAAAKAELEKVKAELQEADKAGIAAIEENWLNFR